MRPHHLTLAISILVTACVPGPIGPDDGAEEVGPVDSDSTSGSDSTTSSDDGTTDDGMVSDLPPRTWPAGEPWGPCPIDGTTGRPTLCNEGIACVPSLLGNMCLPVGGCPDDPGFGLGLELGWGSACYPRCEADSDCADGMICDVSLNLEPMCSWPTESSSAPACWTVNGFEWCVAEFNDLLVVTPCEPSSGGAATWPYACALGQPIDAAGWDAAWCDGSCWGLLDGVVMSILPECMVDFLGAEPATAWTSGCEAGLPIPVGWDEWRCGPLTCFARVGALWTTPMPLCASDEWLPCEP